MNDKLAARVLLLQLEAQRHGWQHDTVPLDDDECAAAGCSAAAIVGAQREPFTAATAVGLNARTGRVVGLAIDGKQAVRVEHDDGRSWFGRTFASWEHVMRDPWRWCGLEAERYGQLVHEAERITDSAEDR